MEKFVYVNDMIEKFLFENLLLKHKIVSLELELGLSKDSISNTHVITKWGNSSIDKWKSIINDCCSVF